MQANMQQLQQIVSHFRSLLNALDIPPKVKPQGYVLVKGTEDQVAFLSSTTATMAILSKLKDVRQL